MRRKPSDYRKCRVCGAKVKIKNLEDHFSRVHPQEVNRLRIQKPRIDRCVICGKKTSDSSITVCDGHIVEILPRFMVGKALLSLRRYVDKIIQNSANECVDYFLQFVPISIFAEMGTNTEKIGYEELVLHSNRSAFLSYVLLRLCQAIPTMGERALAVASRDSSHCKLRTRYDTEFMEVLRSEFEFFYVLYYGIQGLYNIATDSEEAPSKIIIIPKLTPEVVRKMLMLRIRNSEFIYRSSLYPVIHRSSMECLYDENGGFLCYPRSQIRENYNLFKEMWLKTFGSKLPLSYSGYMDFLWHFRWVACPIGFTKQKKYKAYNICDYKGLDDETLFFLLDAILPDVCSKKGLISTKLLGTEDSNHKVLIGINRLSWAFRFSSDKGNSYFLPPIDWLHNSLTPLLVQFGRTLNAAGTFFEDWIEEAVEAFAHGLLGFQFTEEFGYVPVRRRTKAKRVITDWRILEKNLKIEIANNDKNNGTIERGEIDLIVYANYNIYLLELKSANLSGKKATKYQNKKAPVQCSKYVRWVRKQNNLKSLLAKHGIPEHKVGSVRVLCCTNGVYDRTSVMNTDTGERFAVLPLFLLLNLFAGVFTVAVKDVLPFFCIGVRNGLKYAFPSLKEAYLLDNSEKLSKTANSIIQDWYALMTFDRRQNFENFRNKESRSFDWARFFVLRETYIGDTSNWVLSEPLFLSDKDGFRYYVGTQIANAGTTLLCTHCKSAIKYYYAPNEHQNSNVYRILSTRICPFCHKPMKNASENVDIISNMSVFVLNLRNQVDSKLLSIHKSFK